MLAGTLQAALFATSLLAGLPWIRSGSVAPEDAKEPGARPAVATPSEAPDRVAVFTLADAAYQALAIPRSYKTAPNAPTHLLVFRGGLCVRDIGLEDTRQEGDEADAGRGIVEESGTIERAFAASDGSAGVIVRTRYVSRVDLRPASKSAEGDAVTGGTTVTFIDPAHPDGAWRVTLESSRWASSVLVLPASRGVVLMTFVPRRGPADVRILDRTGHEFLRVPESSGETVRIEASPDGGHAAAEIVLPDDAPSGERAVMVFDVADGTHWSYGWRYGSDAEPLSWSLQERGVLAVKLVGKTLRFDARGRRL